MKWNIDKQFDFCYGHRVWNQALNAEFSLDSCLACRHLHGHQGKIKIHLEAEVNPEKVAKGMVTDFKHLNWFKKWVDDTIDHKIIFDLNDPLLRDELWYVHSKTGEYKFEEIWTPNYLIDDVKKLDKLHPEVYYTINFDLLNTLLNEDKEITDSQAQAIFEKYEGLILVEFIPTSENLTSWFLKIVEAKMKTLMEEDQFVVKSIEFWETPKSHCQVIS